MNLKGIDYTPDYIHLRRKDHRSPAYLDLNPQGLVPTLVDGEDVLTQSLAILEYIDEIRPHPAFLPQGAMERAKIRSIAQLIACDIHPVNNLRILRYLGQELGVEEPVRDVWYRHWVETGFEALERMIAGLPGPFIGGASPGLADICLVPQVYNGERFSVDTSRYPTIAKINAACLELDAFTSALPENQPDAG